MAHINIASGSCHLHARSSLHNTQPHQVGCLNARLLSVQHRRRASSAVSQARHRHRCTRQAASNTDLAEAPVRAPVHAEEAAAEDSPPATASADEAAAAAAGVGEGSAGRPEKGPVTPEQAKRWEQAIKWQEEGTVATGRIQALHKAGVVVRFAPSGLRGFLPWQRMDPQRLPNAATASQEDLGQLLKQEVKVKVLQVNVPKRQMLLSERAALFREMAAKLSEGDVVEGVVTKVVSYGAFVNLKDADGHLGRISGMIHISELAWNRVNHPEDVVSAGQALQCKVLRLDVEKDRIDLSLKAMEADPLLENLDGLLPLEVDAPGLGSVPANLPAAVEDLCAALQAEPGVDDISVGRQVEEKRAVSQDLELWMSKEAVEDGYNVVVRAGRLVQEIHVVTRMPADDMKAAVQRVLRQLV